MAVVFQANKGGGLGSVCSINVQGMTEGATGATYSYSFTIGPRQSARPSAAPWRLIVWMVRLVSGKFDANCAAVAQRAKTKPGICV